MDLATVTPSKGMCKRIGQKTEAATRTLGNFGTPERLLNNDIATCVLVSTEVRRIVSSILTLGAQCDADSVRQNINTFENAGSALVRKLDLLMRASGERGLLSLGSGTTERPGGSGRQAVHFEYKKGEKEVKEEEGGRGGTRSCKN